MNALEEMFYNPLGSKWLWALGIGAGALAVGATAYAATRSTQVSPGQSGVNPSNTGGALTDPTTMQAVQNIILNVDSTGLCTTGNQEVAAFQNAWNAAGGSPTLPTSGLYDQATASAATQVNGSAPTFPNCAAGS